MVGVVETGPCVHAREHCAHSHHAGCIRHPGNKLTGTWNTRRTAVESTDPSDDREGVVSK